METGESLKSAKDSYSSRYPALTAELLARLIAGNPMAARDPKGKVMKMWKMSLSVATMVGMTSGVWAQVPAGPPPGGAAVATPAVVATPAPAGGGTIWNFFGINKAGLRECKVRLCKSNIGMMLGNMMKPAGAMSGGLLPQCCPKVLQDDTLAKAAKGGPDAPSDAQVAAAKIAKSEAEAKERRAAVRYLGTVDCHYWGDIAEPALILALRKDPNECVRWEAAMALGNGCCCTKATITALTLSVYGVDKDKQTVAGAFKDDAPVETSERVKATALMALQHCLSCYSETAAPAPEKSEPPPERPIAKAPGMFQPAVYDKQPVHARTMSQVIQDARQVTMTPTPVGATPIGGQINAPASNHTLAGVFSNAFSSTPRQTEGPSLSEAQPMAAPPPRYSGLLPWLTR